MSDCSTIRAQRDAEMARLPGLDATVTATAAVRTAANAAAEAAWIQAMDALADETAAINQKNVCVQTINGLNQLLQMMGCSPI